jgi:tetratricopeptide (TPR) repeat protein
MRLPRLRVWPRVAAGEVPDGAVVVRLEAGDALDVAIQRGGDELALRLPLEVGAIGLAARSIAFAVGDLLDSAPGADPARDATAMVLRARRRIHQQGFAAADSALALMTNARALQPDDPRIAAALAMTRVRFGLGAGGAHLDGVRELVAQALADGPELADTHVAAAFLEQQVGDPGVAAAHFRAAIARAPYRADGHEGLGRMLLEAGFLDDGMRRLDDAIAISPDLVNTRWEIARAHALEENWVAHDALVDELVREAHNPFYRMRFAWWRGDHELVRYIRDAYGGGASAGFEPELIERLYAVVLDGAWPEHREAILGRARATTPSRRRSAFIAQLAADAAGHAGDLPACVEMIELAVDCGLYDLHWFDRCPTLRAARGDARAHEARARVQQRADRIFDALFGDGPDGFGDPDDAPATQLDGA